MRILNSTQLAELFCLSPLSIHSTLVRRPDRLPPPVRVPGSNRLIWLEPDVIAWLQSHKAKVAEAPRKRGRPLKQPQVTLDTLARRNLMRAAIHECSHAAVARHFGSEAQPHIFKSDVCIDEYHIWHGTCKVNFAETVTQSQRRMIGIAGLTGEFLCIEHEDEVSALTSIIDELLIDDDVMSATDRALSDGINDDEILTTIRLLASMRDDVEREAKALAREAKR